MKLYTKAILLIICSFYAAGLAFGKAVPAINYVTVVPETQTTFAAGSKPSVKITLSAPVATITTVSLTAEDLTGTPLSTNVATVPIVTLLPGERSATVQTTLTGATTDVSLDFVATLGSSTVTSRLLVLQHASMLRITIADLTNPVSSNVIHKSDAIAVKVTLTGIAPAGGFELSNLQDSGALSIFMSSVVSIGAGSSIETSTSASFFSGLGTFHLSYTGQDGITVGQDYTVQ
jgi:hypothetical protein